MVSDVAGDPNAMLCLHCARRVVLPRSVSKYEGLESHLKFRSISLRVKLSFARIDGLIGSILPTSPLSEMKLGGATHHRALTQKLG